MENQERRHLAAPCGLYCGACSGLIARERGGEDALKQMAKSSNERWGTTISADDIYCEGCLSSRVAIYCRRCTIRDCVTKKNINYCYQCTDFPCQTITSFNDDGRPHHSEVLANVHRQKQIGLDAWLDEQEKKWHCHSCGYVLQWYDSKCPRCAEIIPKQF